MNSLLLQESTLLEDVAGGPPAISAPPARNFAFCVFALLKLVRPPHSSEARVRKHSQLRENCKIFGLKIGIYGAAGMLTSVLQLTHLLFLTMPCSHWHWHVR